MCACPPNRGSLVERDVTATLKDVRCGQTGYASTDHGHTFARCRGHAGTSTHHEDSLTCRVAASLYCGSVRSLTAVRLEHLRVPGDCQPRSRKAASRAEAAALCERRNAVIVGSSTSASASA